MRLHANALLLGGVAAVGPYVFATDNGLEDNPRGIVRFNTADGSAVRFANSDGGPADQFAQVTIGLNGLLYGFDIEDNATPGPFVIRAFNPWTLAPVRSLSVRADLRAIAVDRDGTIYGLQYGTGTIVRLDSAGNIVASLKTGFFDSCDLRISHDSMLLATPSAGGLDSFGEVALSSTELTSVHDLHVPPAPDSVVGLFGAFAAPTLIVGDLNHDGLVNFTDLLALAQNYGKSGTWATGDLNSDGTVGFDDLLLLVQNYGIGRPSAATAGVLSGASHWNGVGKPAQVPEPLNVATFMAAGALVLRSNCRTPSRRRREPLPGVGPVAHRRQPQLLGRGCASQPSYSPEWSCASVTIS